MNAPQGKVAASGRPGPVAGTIGRPVTEIMLDACNHLLLAGQVVDAYAVAVTAAGLTKGPWRARALSFAVAITEEYPELGAVKIDWGA